jgi:hypothetical protein
MTGATVYDGDRLQTAPNSTLRVRLGSGQMVLRQNSAADVHALPKGFSANLSAANDQATSGQISMISATELVLTGTRGTMLVSMGDEVKTLEAGSSYRLEVESEPEPAPSAYPQGNPRPTARNHFLWIAIPIIAAVTGIVVWRALVSPNAPSN